MTILTLYFFNLLLGFELFMCRPRRPSLASIRFRPTENVGSCGLATIDSLVTVTPGWLLRDGDAASDLLAVRVWKQLTFVTFAYLALV